jgi:hypothetical protein
VPQAQYKSGNWSDGLALFQQLQQVIGRARVCFVWVSCERVAAVRAAVPGAHLCPWTGTHMHTRRQPAPRAQNRGASFAAHNGVLHGALLELLVVRGGAAGTLEAIALVDRAHATGTGCRAGAAHQGCWGVGAVSTACRRLPAAPACAHCHAAGVMRHYNALRVPLASADSSAAATSARAGGGSGSPAGAAAFSLFQASTATGLGGGGATAAFGSAPSPLGLTQAAAPAAAGDAAPLAVLDIRGCSAVEALVLVLSWLGQLVTLVAAGQPLPGEALRIDTGAASAPLDMSLALELQLYRPAAAAAGAAGGTGGAAAPAPGDAGAAATAGADQGGPEQASVAAAADALVELAGSPQPAAAAHTYTPLLAAGAAASSTAAAAAAALAAADILDVPGAHISPHTIALAVLSGQLWQLLGGTEHAGAAFEAAGRLPLAALCMSELPLLLLDASQGGGMLLPSAGVAAAVAAAVQAASSARAFA